jgi:lysyl endopeptidase
MTRRDFAICIAIPLAAQVPKPPQPPGLMAKLPAPPQYALPPLPAQPASSDDKGGPLAIGKHRQLPSSALKKGKWTKLPDGQRVWRISILSPGAKGLRVHFAKFAAGKSKVWIYGGPPGDIRAEGSYTGTGIDNTGTFWSDTVFADSMTVEYEPAKGAPTKGAPPFQISEITHLFR